jgi:hypothetical protein
MRQRPSEVNRLRIRDFRAGVRRECDAELTPGISLIATSVCYLGIEVDDALSISERVDL